MQRITLFTFVLACFLIQSVLSGFLGAWFTPNLLIILIVFFNLFRGTRYSLQIAVMAGILKDSFAVNVFGINTVAFILCAYLTTAIKTYIYQAGSEVVRVLLVFSITIVYILIYYCLTLIHTSLDFREVFSCILLPEVLTTTLIAPFVFERLKQCALKSFA
jgi:rod shape-determining protein MreD